MKKLLCASILFILNLTIIGQNEFSFEDVVLNSSDELAPSKLSNLQWIPGSNSFSFVSKDDELLKADVNNSQEEIISINEFQSKVKADLNKNITSFPQLEWIDAEHFIFRIDKGYYLFNTRTKSISTIAELDSDAENMEIAGNNKSAAFTKGNNLFVTLDQNKIKQITNEASSGIVSGKSVHRNEFGIDKGIFWSPRSNYIAFYKMNEMMVDDYPLVNIDETPAKLENIKYPMAGKISHQVEIGIYSLTTGSVKFLKTGTPKDHYLTSVSWSPDENFIYAATLNRDQNYLRLIKYNSKTGDPVKVLFEEENKKYVEPEHPLYFLPNDTNKFIWISRRNGWRHIYLYSAEGNLIDQITNGRWEVTSFEGFDRSGENAFFTATKESPVERHFYKVNLNSKKITKLTNETGHHTAMLSPSGRYFLDQFSSLDVPGITSLKNADGELMRTVHTADNPIKNYDMGDVKIFTIQNNEGDTLYCRMVYPIDFDKSKKYPVVTYVYGGPHVQLVLNKWYYGKYDFWFQKMAQNGFVVFTLDNRGSANRGLEFEQKTFRQLGTVEIEDQLAGAEYLAGLDFIDDSRMGIFGWSYGGFMTTSLMLRTDKFDVGVAGGAVIDWNLYEVMYTERYMDTPKENTEGYDKANLLNYVENLNGKLLMVHGTNDPTVVWQQTLRFTQKAVELNKDLDYFPYIGHGHGVSGSDAVHLYKLITNYFIEIL